MITRHAAGLMHMAVAWQSEKVVAARGRAVVKEILGPLRVIDMQARVCGC